MEFSNRAVHCMARFDNAPPHMALAEAADRRQEAPPHTAQPFFNIAYDDLVKVRLKTSNATYVAFGYIFPKYYQPKKRACVYPLSRY